MEIKYKDIILRDFRLEDIEDEIRWTNIDVDWMKADAPWEELEKIDEAEIRAQREEWVAYTGPETERWRFEIEYQGRHIGFCGAYLMSADYEPLLEVPDGLETIRAVSVWICQREYRNRGLGTQALQAFCRYYMDKGDRELCLETHSGNLPMIRVAQKSGFSICRCDKDLYWHEGKTYDGLIYKVKRDELSE